MNNEENNNEVLNMQAHISLFKKSHHKGSNVKNSFICWDNIFTFF